jgi:hypothetical protein
MSRLDDECRSTHDIGSSLPISPGRHFRSERNRLVSHPCGSLVTYHLHVVVDLQELIVRQYGQVVRRRIRSKATSANAPPIVVSGLPDLLTCSATKVSVSRKHAELVQASLTPVQLAHVRVRRWNLEGELCFLRALAELAVHAMQRGRGIELGPVDGCEVSDHRGGKGRYYERCSRTACSVECHMERVCMRQLRSHQANLCKGGPVLKSTHLDIPADTRSSSALPEQ